MKKDDKKTLLFVTTELPWPANTGGKIKTFGLLREFSRRYRVLVVAAYGGSQEDLHELVAASGVESAQTFQHQRKRTPWTFFRALMGFPTLNSFRIFSRPMESMLKWAVAKADYCIADHLEVMEMIEPRYWQRFIYHSHNAEFRLWRDYAKLVNPLIRWVVEWEAERVKVFESKVIRKTRFTFAAPNDIEALMRALKLPESAFRITYHLGNDRLLDEPSINIASNEPVLFYAGMLSWTPNDDGMRWFLKEVWPTVITRVPEARLTICGKGASEDLKKLMSASSGVQYKGYVPDLEPEMQACRAALVPLRFGSGMNIKAFEALYRGLPLVTTNVGAEGIEISHGEHAMISQDAVEMAAHIESVLRSPREASEMAQRARVRMRNMYTYEQMCRQMIGQMEESALS